MALRAAVINLSGTLEVLDSDRNVGLPVKWVLQPPFFNLSISFEPIPSILARVFNRLVGRLTVSQSYDDGWPPPSKVEER
jgi:hypothetical protein